MSPSDDSDVDSDVDLCPCCHALREVLLPRKFTCTWAQLQEVGDNECIACGHSQDAIKTWLGEDEIQNDTPITIKLAKSIWAIHLPGYDLEVFLLQDVDHPLGHGAFEIMMYHALPCDTAGEHALATIKNWIRECVIEHEECDDGSLRLLPKRILEIEGDKLLLREDRTEPAHYACLSHCWGANGPQQRLTHGSYEIHKEGLIIEILPPTFYDAVQLCKRLHLRYIWIDALCIVQDDFEDWNETAGLMAEIYSNAYITIGASGAMDCTRGLYTKLPMRPKELGNAPGLFVMPLSRPHDDFGTLPLPLLTRAWVFQEHVVSPRFLHFGPGFLLWKCRNTQCTETGDVSSQGWAPFFYNLLNNQFPEIASQALKILDKVHSWHRIIEGYSNLKLTYDTDRLAAISAVVYRHMKNRAGDRYIAGMWENSLLPDLSWGVMSAPSTESRSCPPNTPSWSWASTRGAVSFPFYDELIPQLRIVSLRCDPVGLIHLGKVSHASVKIEGLVARGILDYSIHHAHAGLDSRLEFCIRSFEVTKGLGSDFNTFMQPDYDFQHGQAIVKDGIQLTILMIAIDLEEPIGIVLRKVSHMQFERIGRVVLPVENCRELLAALPVETVTII